MQFVMPFMLAMVVTMAAIPVFARVAGQWLYVDFPGGRKVHETPIPRIGGLAIAAGVFVAAAIAIPLRSQDLWFLAATALLVLFGALDDRLNLDYRIKLAGQLIAVGLAVFAGGVRIQSITLDDRMMLPVWLSLPLSVVFLVGITNAINLADGLDGLAGGTTFLCLCAIALLSTFAHQWISATLAATFAGAVLGFLPFNTYPASVFMGDAGSQLLGFAIGVLSVRATQNPLSLISTATPILLLAVPILDTLSVMVQRVAEGSSPFHGDKNHIHHKLLALGFAHHEAVIVIYAVQALLFVMAYLLRFESDVLILAVVGGFFFVAIGSLQVAAHRGWRLRQDAEQAADTPLRVAVIAKHQVWLTLWSYRAIAASLSMYAALVVAETEPVRRNFRILALGLLGVLVAFFAILRVDPLSIVEKVAVYVVITLIVYLDVGVVHHDPLVMSLSWIPIGIMGTASVIRTRAIADRRFQLTPLDLIILFIVLVVPNLPGILRVSQAVALAIAKLFILFFAIEVLFSRA